MKLQYNYNSVKTNGKEFIMFSVYKLSERIIEDWVEIAEACQDMSKFHHHPHDLEGSWIVVGETLRLGEDITIQEIKEFVDKEVYSIEVHAITEGARYDIDNIGVEEAIWPDGYNELVEDIMEYAKAQIRPQGLSDTYYNPAEILTIWEYWTDKSWSAFGWEYDSGMEYCGILDKNKLCVLERKECG